MTLDQFGGQLDLRERVYRPDGGHVYPVLFRTARNNTSRTSTLSMQLDGNLVWRDDAGAVVLASNTAGTGSHNYAKLLDTGQLVVRTAAGRTVWTSRTTNVFVAPSDQLTRGHSLVNRTSSTVVTTLSMRSDGDLVLLRIRSIAWQTGTHVAGPHLAMNASGRLGVVTPQGTWCGVLPRSARAACCWSLRQAGSP